MFNAKFNWISDDDISSHEAYLGGSVVLGMTLGAVNGGLLMRIGRRRAVLVCCIIGIAGVSTTMVWNYYAILAGRFMYGFSVGLISSICPKFIEEVVPQKLFDVLAPVFNFSQSCGTIFAYFWGEILPDDTET